MTISASVFRNIIYAAVRKGADLALLCDKIGIQVTDLDDSKKRFSLEEVDALFYHGIALTKDPIFGLHIGEQVDFTAFGIVGFMMQSSPDVFTALERGSYYNNLVSDLIRSSFEKKGDKAVFKIYATPTVMEHHPLVAKHGIEDTMSFLIKAVQKLSGKKCLPQLVSFAFPNPREYIKEYERVFPTILVFNEVENTLVYRLKDLESPVIGYNQNLFELLDQQAQQILDNLSKEESFAQKVTRIIIQLFNQHFPTIELVASEMNLSVRSLQRRLKREEKTFQDLLDAIRKEFAMRYLKNKELSISQVAYLLGFSEPSVFSRSFKRWMGCSPKEYLAR